MRLPSILLVLTFRFERRVIRTLPAADEECTAPYAKNISFKGFDVTVDLEPVWEPSGSAVPSLPSGCVAIVSIGMRGLPTPLVSPFRLVTDNQKPFETKAAALMAGFSAGQRVIDNELMPG